MTAAPPPVKITLRPNAKGRQPWLIGLGLALLCLLIFFAVVAGSAVTAKEGSTYSQAPGGYRDWYRYMETEYNLPVQRWRKPFNKLTGTGQTLIQIQPGNPLTFFIPNTEIRDWVVAGNTLIKLGWFGRATSAPFRSELKTSVGPVVIETTRRLPRFQNSSYNALLKDKYGAVVWVESEGAGKIVNISYPYLAANAHKGEKANFAYLAKLARDLKERGMEVRYFDNPGDGFEQELDPDLASNRSKIWVDEWSHGYRDRETTKPGEQTETEPLDTFSYLLLRTPALAILLQLAWLLIWLIWGLNRRFGPIQIPTPPETANSERYVQALSEVLNAAGHTDFIFAQLGQRLRQQLASDLGLAADRAPVASLPADPEIANAWAQQTGKPAQEVLKLLQQTSGGRRPSEPELFAWVKAAKAVLQR